MTVCWGQLTYYQTTNFRLFQMTISNLTKKGRKLSKRVENTVGKGEIARYEQFLLFPQCFHKACFPGASKGVIVWEWVNPFSNKPLFLRVCTKSHLKTLWEKEKRAISPYPTVFSTLFENFLPFL